LLLSSGLVLAEEAEEQAPEWQGSVQIGYVASSGNSENTNINGKVNVQHDDENWFHDALVQYYSSSDADTTTAERYKLSYQGDYKLEDEDHYLFVNSSYEDDRFSGFNYRATLTAGYGSRLYRANDMELDGEIGAGFRYSEEEGTDSENEAMIRLAAKYKWTIAEDKKLTSNISVEEGEEVRVTNFDIGFTTMIVGGVSMKAAYEARHVSDVPEGKDKLDTVVSLNLLYSF
jgi:putative salt-induced outer membrane protein YdiY